VESEIVAPDLAEKLLRRLAPEDRLVLVLEELEGASDRYGLFLRLRCGDAVPAVERCQWF
jgi:hypothetical protein